MTDPDPERARERFADRLRDAGLDTERFINVLDGEKATHDHNQRAPDDPRLSGNYGVYAGRGAGDDGDGWLVDVDVDDYAADGDTDALDAVRDLPATLTVETPHTDGETGGHRFYRMTGNVLAAMQAVTGGASNPSPSWGEVRVANQYVVGPGSQLDGCDKPDCEVCATPDGGRYRIATDHEIASITADELADVLHGDPAYAGEDTADAETVEYDADGDTNAEAVAQAHDWVRDYLAFGADDRSAKDHAVCATMVEHGVAEDDARALLNGSPRTKVHERGAGYWRSTWQSAVRAADPDGGDENAGRSGVSTDEPGVRTVRTTVRTAVRTRSHRRRSSPWRVSARTARYRTSTTARKPRRCGSWSNEATTFTFGCGATTALCGPTTAACGCRRASARSGTLLGRRSARRTTARTCSPS